VRGNRAAKGGHSISQFGCGASKESSKLSAKIQKKQVAARAKLINKFGA
jgi:hypothetical protein